jgi:hypothetical protein
MSLEVLLDSKGNEVVFITNEDGSTISMAKSTYDAMQAKQSTPIVTGDVNAD